jgi:hypothetical protein
MWHIEQLQLVTGPSSIGGDVFTVNLGLSVQVRWLEWGASGRQLSKWERIGRLT